MLSLCLLVGLARASPVVPHVDAVSTSSYHQPEAALRIIGGAPIVPNKWPFLVAIIIKDYADADLMKYGLTCGGSLVGEKTVLTAAHCMLSPDVFNEPRPYANPDDYIVHWYGHDLETAPDPETCDENIEIESFTCHAGYRSDPSKGSVEDLCLVFLKKTPRCLCAPDASDNQGCGRGE